MIVRMTGLLLAVLVGSGAAVAESTDDSKTPERKMPSLADLPDSLRHIERATVSNAAQQVGVAMLAVDPDGNVSAESLARYETVLIAAQRAQEMQQLIAVDLDFDGSISAAERKIVVNRMERHQRVQLALLLAEADSDADGVISGPEMRAVVVKQTGSSKMSKRNLDRARDLMIFDLDGDGVATLREMAKAVRAMLSD